MEILRKGAGADDFSIIASSYVNPKNKIAFLVNVFALIFLAACSRNNPLSTSTLELDKTLESSPTKSLQSQATETPRKTATMPVTPTDQISSLPPKTTLLEVEEFNVSFEIHEPSDIKTDQVIAVFNSDELYTEIDQVRIDYLTWDGTSGPLISIGISDEEDTSSLLITAGSVPYDSNSILVILLEFSRAKEFYVLNLVTGDMWGIDPGCSEPIYRDLDILLGSRYVAFRCGEARESWYLISIVDPHKVLSFQLPTTDENLITYEPRWIDESTLVLEDSFHQGLCLVQAPEWQASCWGFPYWAANMSPDASLVEVRVGGFYLHPTELGFLSSTCFASAISCEPRLREGLIAASERGQKNLERAAWLENGLGLLYTVHIDTDTTNLEADETEFWLLDPDTMEAELIGHYEVLLFFNLLSSTATPSLWSPNGEWIAVSGAGNHYFLSVRTGELIPITTGGFLLGPLNLDNAPEN